MVLFCMYCSPCPFLQRQCGHLSPKKIDDCDTSASGRSVFITTVITFFIAEIGDKTQLATVALAAQFQSFIAVVTGTTLGMMAANVPAVLFSHAAANKIPLKMVRIASGMLFADLGIYEVSRLSKGVFMKLHDISAWTHKHDYKHGCEQESKRRTLYVVAITSAMMVTEIICGWLFNSMAVLADGWHMSTHALALAAGYFAYRFARTHKDHPASTFGSLFLELYSLLREYNSLIFFREFF